jgi:hypothetical protein
MKSEDRWIGKLRYGFSEVKLNPRDNPVALAIQFAMWLDSYEAAEALAEGTLFPRCSNFVARELGLIQCPSLEARPLGSIFDQLHPGRWLVCGCRYIFAVVDGVAYSSSFVDLDAEAWAVFRVPTEKADFLEKYPLLKRAVNAPDIRGINFEKLDGRYV